MVQSPESIKTRFQPGNELWRLAPQLKPIYANGEELWLACVEYFKWASDNPLMEMKAFSVNGEVQTEELPKMRAMSIRALTVFLGINRETWYDWKKSRADLKETIEKVEDIIFAQKFEGASAGLLVPTIIMRDLGLADKQEVTGRDGGPIAIEDVTRDADDFASRMAGLAARADGDGVGEVNAGSEGNP